MKKFLLGAAAIALLPAAANAATDGTLGPSSTGSTEINVTIPAMVNIRGLKDIAIPILTANISEANPNNRAGEGTTTFCVFSNVDGQGSYKVSATSALAGVSGNPFGLTGPEGSQLNYAAWYRDQPTSPWNGQFLNRNQSYAMQNTAGNQLRATDLNCSNVSGGNNASLGVGVRNSVALAALAGTYTGTLTVTVSAE